MNEELIEGEESLTVEQGILVSLKTIMFYMEPTNEKDIFRIGIIATLDFSVLRSQKGLT